MNNFHALPTKAQKEWADCEIGVIIHLDMQVFEPAYHNFAAPGKVPPATAFNPGRLDTDQWMECARALGATYAIFVARHGSGFANWPTKTYPYNVASSPWKDGHGDVVADFIASCGKYGIRPGLYACCGTNEYLGVNNYQWISTDGKNSDDRHAYADIVKRQLRELWGNYGPLFEIWFDGGCFPGESVEQEIMDMALELQPNAVFFQGDPKRVSTVRWIGNERAEAPYPCYARTNFTAPSDGICEEIFAEQRHGSLDGSFWAPGEADMTIRDKHFARDGGWMWTPGEDALVYPPEHLLDCYFTSVGRNCNLLVGMCIDNRGLVPDADAKAFREAGRLIKKQFEHPLRGETTCHVNAWGQTVLEFFPKDNVPVHTVCIMEDLDFGENVKNFILSGYDGTCWHSVLWGYGIGHKFLARLPGTFFQAWQLKIFECLPDSTPRIRDFSLYA